jgi:hypothetical protein
MENTIIDIANTYMAEHDGELPLLVVAHKEGGESRIMRCHLREKHAQVDQQTFISVMRLAMIVYGYDSYEFVVKPEFNYQALQMTKNVWAVGQVGSNESQTKPRCEFYVIEDEKLVPYFEEMPIGGNIAQLLPSGYERQKELPQKVTKQIKLYVENCTYNLPVKEDAVATSNDGFDALFAQYE